MPDAMPSRRPRGRGLVCPSCNGDSFAERSSFKTASEALLGEDSTEVAIVMMSCSLCGADFPIIRGRRRHMLVERESLSTTLSELEKAKRTNSEMNAQIEAMAKSYQQLSAEVQRCRAEGEISVLRARVAALEAETEGMEARRARLAKALEIVASAIPTP